MRRLIGAVLICLIIVTVFSGCGAKENDYIKIIDAYIDGFSSMYEQGNEYTDLGLQLQADYAYGWAAASVSSMRYCVDCLLYLEGEGDSLEDLVGERLGNWDEIAAQNYASPYPYFFEGLVYNSQGKNEDAKICYEKALVNPKFSAENDESLLILDILTVRELKSVKKKLTGLEDRIYEVYSPVRPTYPPSHLNYSDKYHRTLAKERLTAFEDDYRGALRHYEVALSVNPFEGDNFVGCALMHMYLGDIDETFFYVNEGLYVDPDHEGLNRIAELLNEEVGER
jgi:tetratricopeptide (TPR) repeat protein